MKSIFSHYGRPLMPDTGCNFRTFREMHIDQACYLRSFHPFFTLH